MREAKSSAEYQARAAECERKAVYAKSTNHRMILLDEAQTWRRLAYAAEVVDRTRKTLEATRAV